MRPAPRYFAVLIAGLASFAPLSAQTSPTPQQPAAQPQSTLSTSTQLVVVDVTVQDRNGTPVHSLKASDFLLQENRKPQPIRSFDEHTPAQAAAHQPLTLPKLPPGNFTDYTPVPEDSTLNILLLDTLNTPMKDQAYVRSQLQQYVKKAQPGTRVAIFGLTSRLILLQGFTSDPETLKAAVEHRLIPRASVLLDDPSGANTDPNVLSDTMSSAGASAQTVANMQQFEAQNATFQTQMRVQYTIDAFNALGRYLATFPGRKNLIWFSGSFPLTIFPDANLDNPFAVQSDFSDALRLTSGLLARARVAVYPIDARGLQTNPMMDASRSGAGYARNPSKFADDTGKFLQQTAAEHMSMEQVAEDTGGHAFYNTNGLADAVNRVIDAGSSYYTLTFSPANRNWNGDYRRIDVKLSPEAAARGLKLAYRHGYYADDPANHKVVSSVLNTAPTNVPVTGTAAFARASMDRGAPAPSEILFKVRVLPVSTATEDAVAPHNNPNPAVKGPFRRFQVDYAALPGDFKITKESDGKFHGRMEFIVYVYDRDGRLLNADVTSVSLALPPEIYGTMIKSGLKFASQVSAPAKGDSFLRIAIHDVPSGRMGIVEIASDAVSHLPPLPPNEVLPTATPAPSAGSKPSSPAGDGALTRQPPTLGPATPSSTPTPTPR